MISKTIMILAVAAAFVAGSITTGTMAYGASTQGKPFGEILDLLNDLSDSFKLHDEDVSRHSTAEQLVQYRDAIDELKTKTGSCGDNCASLSELQLLEERVDDLEADVEEIGHKVQDLLGVANEPPP